MDAQSISATPPNTFTIVEGATITAARNILLPPTQPADNATNGVWRAYESRPDGV